MCQGCVDKGYLTQQTYDALEVFCDEWPDAEYGPAHVVLGDSNVDDGCVKTCLKMTRAALTRSTDGLSADERALLDELGWYQENHTAEELAATAAFLERLLETPEDDR